MQVCIVRSMHCVMTVRNDISTASKWYWCKLHACMLPLENLASHAHGVLLRVMQDGLEARNCSCVLPLPKAERNVMPEKGGVVLQSCAHARRQGDVEVNRVVAP